MTTQPSLELLRARLSYLNAQLVGAQAQGDFDRMETLRVDIEAVEASIAAAAQPS